MSVVHRTSGHLPPPAVDLPSEVEVVTRLAAAVMPDGGLAWDGFRRDHARTRGMLERAIPCFYDCNDGLREPGGWGLATTLTGDSRRVGEDGSGACGRRGVAAPYKINKI